MAILKAAVDDDLEALEVRTWSDDNLGKKQSVGRTALGPEHMPQDGGIYDYPCNWLVGQLQAGRYPRYAMDHLVRLAEVRR